MPAPKKPTDLYVVNGWYLELPGLVSPHFETLEGISRQTNTVSIVDAGSNRKYNFSGQISDFGQMQLTRTTQGTVDDSSLAVLVRSMIELGIKVPCVAVKKHNSREVYRILFTGFRFTSEVRPTLDVNSEEKHMISYGATCDDWEVI